MGKAKLSFSSSFLNSTDRFTGQNQASFARSLGITEGLGMVDKKGHSWTAAWTLNQPKIGSAALGQQQISGVLTPAGPVSWTCMAKIEPIIGRGRAVEEIQARSCLRHGGNEYLMSASIRLLLTRSSLQNTESPNQIWSTSHIYIF